MSHHHVELRGGGNLIIRAEAETRIDLNGTPNKPPSVILYKNLAFVPTGEITGTGSQPIRHVYKLVSTARLINIEGVPE